MEPNVPQHTETTVIREDLVTEENDQDCQGVQYEDVSTEPFLNGNMSEGMDSIPPKSIVDTDSNSMALDMVLSDEDDSDHSNYTLEEDNQQDLESKNDKDMKVQQSRLANKKVFQTVCIPMINHC
ncbi:hypothetical protein C0991_010079 [Blastosporella zonata]|nr:hypothetical protein C0991_010079 [Blastosporella zonata]